MDSLDKVGVDNVLFETDYPHSDSTWPNTKQVAEKLLHGLSDEAIYKIVRGNAIKMLQLEQFSS
jgi:predicted TIM-barrel fold metal-dependent hydrolase